MANRNRKPATRTPHVAFEKVSHGRKRTTTVRWVGGESLATSYYEQGQGRFVGHIKVHWNLESKKFLFPNKSGRCPGCWDPVLAELVRALGEVPGKTCKPRRLSRFIVFSKSQHRPHRGKKRRVGPLDHPGGPRQIELESKQVFEALLKAIPGREKEELHAEVYRIFEHLYGDLAWRAFQGKAGTRFSQEDDDFLMQSKMRYMMLYGLPRLEKLLDVTFQREAWKKVPQLRPHIETHYKEMMLSLVRRSRRGLKVKPLLTRKGRTPTRLADWLD